MNRLTPLQRQIRFWNWAAAALFFGFIAATAWFVVWILGRT